ncbi:MAG: hypothetical protein NZO58_04280 [Gemmataceae bacterium]|nr:hypothetical protein [Gemmataceae bacterium]
MNEWLIAATAAACLIPGGQKTADSAEKIAAALRELEPRLISFSATDGDVDTFLEALRLHTGNRVIDRRQRKTPLPPLTLAKATFWQALDQFARQAQCGYSPYGGGIALVDAPNPSRWISYHGITRVSVKRIAVVRDFETASGLCIVHLDVAWEPRFEPFYLGLGPATAQFAVAKKESPIHVPSRGQLPVAGRSAAEVELQLPAPPRSAPALATLTGSLRFLGPSKMLTFVFDDVKAGAVQVREEVTVRLNQVKQGLDRWLLEVQIDNPEGTPVFESFQSWLDNNRVRLVKETGGKRHTWLPEANETIHFENHRKAVIEYAFRLPRNEPRRLPDWTLEVRTPGRIVELTVPYEFSNVPLP